MSIRLLFIGGIHGVGKTTLAEGLALELGVQCFSAGHLIREQLRSVRADKTVVDIEQNQDALVLAARARIRANAILDGHFCLLGALHEVRPIPVRTFVDLALTALLLVKGDVFEACRRLKARDGQDYDPSVLAMLQDAEAHHAEHVSAVLRCPLLRVDAEDTDSVRAFARHTLTIC